MLPIRNCGGQGFECAAQGLGCMSMSAFYKGFERQEAQAESLRVLRRAARVPGIMLDTSDFCGPHTNERLLGKIVPLNRSVFKVTSKCGIVADGNPVEGMKLDSSPEYIKKACQASLERLGVDCIDLYYLHRYDQKTPIEDTMRGFKELVEEGKIKYVGVSELGAEYLRRAHAVHPITAYQMEWSVFTRDVEKELVPMCRALGIGIVAYCPLGRGLLTGVIKKASDIPDGDLRHFMPRSSQYLDENLKLIEIIQEIADAKQCTVGQVALAWVHAQGEDVFPIPGTKRLDRFEENMKAFDVKLLEEDMSKLNAIAGKIKGDRHTKEMMKIQFNGQQQTEVATVET